jgi:hypothetical protein
VGRHTAEAVRQRRLRERWAKVAPTADVARRAHLAADRASATRASGDLELDEGLACSLAGILPLPDATSAPTALTPGAGGRAEEGEHELRARVLGQHRADWRMARGLLADAVRTLDPTAARVAKIAAETMRLVQEGERRAWGLDVAPLDLEAMSDQELERLAKGHVPYR